jgi:hypothetical protein
VEKDMKQTNKADPKQDGLLFCLSYAVTFSFTNMVLKNYPQRNYHNLF